MHGQYFFSDLFDIPEIVDFVKVGGVEPRLLSLICSGTYSDFRANPELYGTHLETALLEKLKLLTLCTLAETNRKLPYAQVRATLDLDSEGEVEGLVIKAIYAGLVEVSVFVGVAISARSSYPLFFYFLLTFPLHYFPLSL